MRHQRYGSLVTLIIVQYKQLLAIHYFRTISDAKSPESVTNLENFENLKIEENDTKAIILDKRKTEYFSRREKLDEYLKEKVYPLVSAKMMLQLMATRLDTPCKPNVEVRDGTYFKFQAIYFLQICSL